MKVSVQLSGAGYDINHMGIDLSWVELRHWAGSRMGKDEFELTKGNSWMSPPPGVSSDLWRLLMRFGIRRSLKRGQLLYERGTPVQSASLVLSGMLLIEAGQAAYDFVEPGQPVGAALITRDHQTSTYPVTVTAIAATEIFELPSAALVNAIADAPELREFFQRQFSERMRFIQLCREIQRWTVPHRVAFILLKKPKVIASGNMTRKVLGQIAGTSTESVIRILSKWQEEGLIEVHERKIGILNHEALEKICQGDSSAL